MALPAVVFLAVSILFSSNTATRTYQPTWESLDSRPIPEWFEDAKFGIFVTWGIFSVPAWSQGSIAEWYYQRLLTGSDHNATRNFHYQTYGKEFSYDQFGAMFKAELWDPNKWAELFQNSGAKHVLFISKFCDGWTNWKSSTKWNYNSVDVGPNRDLVGEMANAARAVGLKFGLYYCNIEWGNPLLPWDYERGPQPYHGEERYVEEVFLTELKDLTMKYSPDIINGDYCVLLNSTQLRSREFLAWLYNESPVRDRVVVNDRWGTDVRCQHGGYWTCRDKFEPDYVPPHKWVDLNTIGISWGLNRQETAEIYKTLPELVEMLVSNVAYGGNLLLNVGPTSDGRIVPVMEERLLGMGKWLEVNGEAIYSTRVWRNQTEVSVGQTFTVLANMSNVDNSIPGPKNSTATIKYLGNFHSVDECLKACQSTSFEQQFGKPCLSFTWQANDCPQPEWSSTCYGRTDSYWSPTVEQGHTTGQRDAVRVYYTASKASNQTVFATVMSWPKKGILSLSVPVPTQNSAISLLFKVDYLPLKYQGHMGSPGIVIDLSDVDRDQLPGGKAYSLKMESVN